MKHGQNSRRQRSRNNGRRYPNQRGNSFESNGPDVKVRGTAQQVFDKYQSLARDAFSTGDRVLAEGYLQHAEHYFRILSADKEAQQQRDNARGRGNRDSGNEGQAKEAQAAEGAAESNPESVDDVSKPGAEQPVIPHEESASSSEDREEQPSRRKKPRRQRKPEEQGGSETQAAEQASAAD